MNMKILTNDADLRKNFIRCCSQYNSLHMAVAWAGNPNHNIPYSYIEKFGKDLKVTIGVSFNQTHPDAISFFKEIKSSIRVFKKDIQLFHPKVYLFKKDNTCAIFIGSSNCTFSGFNLNLEANVLIEGNEDELQILDELQRNLSLWHSSKFSFIPNLNWINKYERDYLKDRKKQQENKVSTPLDIEDEISSASWLSTADWDLYLKIVNKSFKNRAKSQKGYKFVLDSAKTELVLPWKIEYLEEMEKRKLIGGRNEYGWFGNAVASGYFAGLLNSGTIEKKKIIIKAINKIAELNPPVDFKVLRKNLNKLVDLGFTMKVWGRLLCLARPDLYCSVCAPSLRKNLSKTLGVTQSSFSEVSGYIITIKHLHGSPWFNSDHPSKAQDKLIWDNRVAFMDAIFY